MPTEQPLGRDLAAAFKAYRSHLDDQLLALEASVPVYLVLLNVAEAGSGASQRHLAVGLGIEGATLTHHLDRLATEGLVRRERSTSDKRVWSAVLTDRGKARLAAARTVVDDNERQLRSLFSSLELINLVDCLARITNHYGSLSQP